MNDKRYSNKKVIALFNEIIGGHLGFQVCGKTGQFENYPIEYADPKNICLDTKSMFIRHLGAEIWANVYFVKVTSAILDLNMAVLPICYLCNYSLSVLKMFLLKKGSCLDRFER